MDRPHKTAGINLGPEIQSHVGLEPCCGKPPLIDERNIRYSVKSFKLSLRKFNKEI